MKSFYSILSLLTFILLISSCASNTEQIITNPDINSINGWIDNDSCWVTGTGSPDKRIQNPLLRPIDSAENAKRDAQKLMLEFLINTYLNQSSADYDTVKNAFIKVYSPLIESGKVTQEKQIDYDSSKVVFVITKKNLRREILSGSALK